MSLMEERLQQAQEMSLGKVIKNYLEKRDTGTTFTVASLGEALNLGKKENNRIYGLLMNATKTGYIKRLEQEAGDSSPVTFRLDKDGQWNPRNSSLGVSYDEPEDDQPEMPTLASAAGVDPELEQPFVIERRVLRFLATLYPGSKFGAHHIAERLAYHTTASHNEIMRVLLRLRKDGMLKSMPGAGKPQFEVITRVVEEAPEKPMETPAVLEAPTLPATALVPVPAAPAGLAELQEQLLTVASALETYRSPLSAYSIAELADEIARRSRGEA